MLMQRDENRAIIRNAYSDMLIQEANEAQHKKLNNAIQVFLKKHKSAFKDFKGAQKLANDIKTHEWDVDIIGLVADLSNTMKDSNEFQDELDKIIDMV